MVLNLAERGEANLARFQRVTTTDPELRAMADALIQAQANQIEQLKALYRFIDTGDLASRAAVHETSAATSQAKREYNRRQDAYRTRHGLTPLQPSKGSAIDAKRRDPIAERSDARPGRLRIDAAS